ncbi:MAG: dolichyl-phosphate beta-D-mannosyltransferase [Candidatus Methanoperedenaceae archaeon]|nr:MAG: dolichyl-phosphate beta-D-mannosyltransferase [Candidatus Methanoperedenaceae archaeon]
MTSIGIINHRLNYIVLGSIIAVTKKYIDKVYVILDKRDDNISDLAISMGVEVIDPSGNGRTFERIVKYGKENNAKFVVTLFGDGTHDPRNIKELIDPVRKNEVDVSVESSSVEFGSYAGNNALSLIKGKAYLETKINNNIGFAACKINCLDNIKFSNNGNNIAEMMLSHARNNSLRVKYLDLNKDKYFGLLNLYKISVVVPAYNEELLIEETVNGIPKYVERIYIVDDCSKDRTPEIIAGMKDPRIVSIRHEKNSGVGAAIITGYKQSLKDNMDIVAVMAGDNQMDPDQLPGLIMPIIDGKADYTKGNRLISKEFRSGMSRWRFIGNAMLSFITKIGCGYWHIMDPQNGYTAISRHALEVIDLDSIYTYYGYCNDLLIKLNTFEMRVMDIVMPARYGRETSKIKYSKYIMKVAPMIFSGFLWRLKTKYVLLNFHPLVFFYLASMVLLPFGVLFSIWILIEKIYHLPVSQNFPLLAVFITLMGVQLLLFAMLFDMQADKSKGLSGN